MPGGDEEALAIENRGLGRNSSEPLPSHPAFIGTLDPIAPIAPQSIDEKVGISDEPGARSKLELSSDKTAVDSQSTGRPPSEEQKARERFLSRFRRKKGEDGNGKGKSRSTGTELSKSASKRSSKHSKFTVGGQLKATIFSSWINVLLVAAPVGIALHFANMSPVAVFVVNFIAIIPLAALLSYATEEIAIRVGETLGGLLNATFGFAVCSTLLIIYHTNILIEMQWN